MFQSIVVGCDGSEGSLAAIELATRLRDPSRGRVTLTSIYPQLRGFGPTIVPSSHADRLETAAEEILALSARRLTPEVPFDRVAMAHPSEPGGLNDVAETVGADLIVLGFTHRHSFGRMTGRMTVQKLLHGAPCAVAVAARHAPTGDGPIVVAFDGSPEAGLAAQSAFNIAAQTAAPVEMVNVIEPVTYMGPYIAAVDPEMERRLHEHAQLVLDKAVASAPEGIHTATRVRWGDPAEVVLEAGAGAGLIVAGSRGYGMTRRAIVGSVSGALLTRASVPVLVTPRAAAAEHRSAA